jgi:hypothetical protein
MTRRGVWGLPHGDVGRDTRPTKPSHANADPHLVNLAEERPAASHGTGLGQPTQLLRVLESEDQPHAGASVGAGGAASTGPTRVSAGSGAGGASYSLIHVHKLGKTIHWACRFALDGPPSMPRWARRLPLNLVAAYVNLTMKANHVRRFRWGHPRPPTSL